MIERAYTETPIRAHCGEGVALLRRVVEGLTAKSTLEEQVHSLPRPGDVTAEERPKLQGSLRHVLREISEVEHMPPSDVG